MALPSNFSTYMQYKEPLNKEPKKIQLNYFKIFFRKNTTQHSQSNGSWVWILKDIENLRSDQGNDGAAGLVRAWPDLVRAQPILLFLPHCLGVCKVNKCTK